MEIGIALEIAIGINLLIIALVNCKVGNSKSNWCLPIVIIL